MVVSVLMYVFGFTQLSSIHLGHDRNFTMLLYNEKATRVRPKPYFTLQELRIKDNPSRLRATFARRMC